MNTQSHNELEKKLQELGEKANKGSNPYESYLALKEKAEEKGFTIQLTDKKEWKTPSNVKEMVYTDMFAEYYKHNQKQALFTAINHYNGEVKTFREENIYDPNWQNDGKAYISNKGLSSDIDTIKQDLAFAIARVNNQTRVVKSNAEKAITDSNYLYTLNVAEKDRLIDFVKNTPDLQGKPLTSQDYLAISDAFGQEMKRENKILETGMSNVQLFKKAFEYYDLYQEKEKQELKEQNLKTYEIEKNGTIQGEIKAESKEEAFIKVSERYGEENFRLIEKDPEIKLYENDWVILDEKDEFVKFNDGQIVIYGDEEEAEADKMKGDKVVNALDLDDEKQNELKENIEEFREIKTERNVPKDLEQDYTVLLKNSKGEIIFHSHQAENLQEMQDWVKNRLDPNAEKVIVKDKDYPFLYDNKFQSENDPKLTEWRQQVKELFEQLNNQQTTKNMEAQQPQTQPKQENKFDVAEYLNNQMKYLGFGDNHKEAIQKGIDSNEKSFQIHTTSDKALFGNKAEFAVNFNKSEKGGVFLNSFDAKLTTNKGEERSQNFRLNFTAKEAINLLEGRAVKTELQNKQGEKFNAFVKLNFAEEKNEFGNYKSKLFNENYGVDTGKIIDELKLKFDKPEYRENAIKALEKGNIIKANFEHQGKEIQGKAFLNVEYKTLNLYNDKMQRLNDNKALQGLAQDNSHEKNNVRQQSISRGV